MTKALQRVHTCTSQSEHKDVNMSNEPFILTGNNEHCGYDIYYKCSHLE